VLKGDPVHIRDVKVRALMTAGRYENTWCRNQIEFSLRAVGIPLVVSGGVYYGQCMQIMLEKAIAEGVEYAVTVDGDTLFSPSQLQRLVNIAVQESHKIDAITGLQVRRGLPMMLGTKDGCRELEWSGYPIKVSTAHFGLTVINLAKLATTEKPWFFCQPNENGEWNGSKIDSDVWFWQQWREAGNSIYIDPEVRLGHMEEMIVIHDDDMKPKHIYPADWVKENTSEKTTTDSTMETIQAGS